MLDNISNHNEDFIIKEVIKWHNNDMKAKIPHICSRSINKYDLVRKKFSYESGELFDKVKKQLNNYLDKLNNNSGKSSSSCLKDKHLNVHRNVPSANIIKRPHRGIFNSILSSTLSTREKNLLKFLLKQEANSINRYVLLTRSLQQHILRCLMEISTKIEGKSGLLDQIRKCPIIHKSKSHDHINHENVGQCKVYHIETLKQTTSEQVNDALRGETYNQSILVFLAGPTIMCGESLKFIMENEQKMIINYDVYRSCCTVVMSDVDLESVVFKEEYPINFEMNESTLARERMGLSRTQLPLQTISAQLMIKTDLMYYSLETMGNNELDCCEQDIYFSYQPNSYNHLLHLYLGLKHQND